jgi:hypothetical protein
MEGGRGVWGQWMNGGRSGPDWASSSGTETLKRCGAGVLVVEHSVD